MLSNGGLKSQSVGKRKILILLRLTFSRETNKVFTLHINEGTQILQTKKQSQKLKEYNCANVNQLYFWTDLRFCRNGFDAKTGQISELKGKHENRKIVTASNFLSVSLT